MFEVSGKILSETLSSYCSIVLSLTLNMFLLTNPAKSKSHCIMLMTIISLKIVFKTFQTPLFHPLQKNLSQQRRVNLDNVKVSFEIFASFDICEKSTSEKCSLHSYHRICLSLKLSQNSKIFQRSLFPEKSTPELT